MTDAAGLDLLTTAVVILDGDLRVRHVNSTCEQLLGSNLRHLQGQSVRELFPDASEFPSKLSQSLVEGRGFVDSELTLGMPNQPPMDVSCVVTPLDGSDPELLIE